MWFCGMVSDGVSGRAGVGINPGRWIGVRASRAKCGGVHFDLGVVSSGAGC